jgi:hypothetical protein
MTDDEGAMTYSYNAYRQLQSETNIVTGLSSDCQRIGGQEKAM